MNLPYHPEAVSYTHYSFLLSLKKQQ